MMTGMSARVGSLECAEHGQAIHPRHHDVEGDQGRVQLAGAPQPLLAAHRRHHPEALLGEEAPQQVADQPVVVHDQDGRRPPVRSCGLPPRRAAGAAFSTSGGVRAAGGR